MLKIRNENLITWRAPLTALLLGMLAFISYQSCITYDFLNYDDQRILTSHPELYNQSNASTTFKAIIQENYPREEPLLLRDLTWALDSRIFGFKNPHGVHFGNILGHSILISLFFLFILKATKRYAVALTASVMALSLAVHVEPVVWIMGRKDILVSCFGLLSMLATIRMTDATGKLAKSLYYLATLFFIILALFSKISAIVFPAALMILAGLRPYLCNNRLPDESLPWQRILYSITIFIPHLIISFVVYRWYNGIITTYGVMDRGYNATTLQHLRNILVINPLVLWRYMSNLFVPANLSLFYVWPNISSDFAWYHITLSVITIFTSLGLTIFMFIKRKDLLCYFLIFAILMVPYLNLIYFGIWVANRYIYFSSFFLLTAIATVAAQLLNSLSKLVRIAIIFLLAIFCIFNTYRKVKYIKVWKNNETLWVYEAELPNPRPEAFENLASHYYTQGTQTADLRERTIYFNKVKDVIEDARRKLGNSPKDKPLPQLHRLLFLDALISIVRDEPPEKRLEKLLVVEKLKPDFDAVLWQLTVFYYKQALSTDDSDLQKKLVNDSIIWYKRYLNAAKVDGEFKKKDKAVREEYISDFPFIEEKINNIPIK